MTPRTQIVESKRDISKEQEFLSQEVRLDGKGEDPWFQALVLDYPDADEVTAKEIALAVQKNLRGEASIEANAELSEVRSQVLQEAAEIEADAKRYNESRAGFVKGVFDRAPKLSKAEAERERQKGLKIFRETVNKVKAGKSVKQAQFKQMLKNAPLVEVNVAPRIVMTPSGHKMLPVTLGILGLRFTLQPGTQKVPKPLAELYEKYLQEQTYSRLKNELWSGQRGIMDVGQLSRAQRELDQKYGVKTS